MENLSDNSKQETEEYTKTLSEPQEDVNAASTNDRNAEGTPEVNSGEASVETSVEASMETSVEASVETSEEASVEAYEASCVDCAEAEDKEKKETGQKKIKALLGDIAFFAVSFAIIYILFRIFPPYYVDGISMNQTLQDKAFGFGTVFFKPDYGDIIVLHGEGDKTHNDDYVKRIVGLPGDILEITDGVIVRNGKPVDEPYTYYDPDYHGINGITQLVVLGEGEYFVMGDNRYHSSDGRVFGPIKRSEMKCKMLFYLWGKKR